MSQQSPTPAWPTPQGAGGAAAFLDLPDDVLVDQCTVHAYRASGPGGQKRNKTSSAIRLHHHPSGVIVQAEEERSQHINRRRAVKRLRMALATHLLRPIDLERYARPPALDPFLHDRRLQNRPGQPQVLHAVNEVLSLLAAAEGRLSMVAERLGVSTASVAKFLELDEHVWRKANEIRKGHGQPALKPRQ